MRLPLAACVAATSGLLTVGLVLGVAGGIDRWSQPAIGLVLPGALVREAATASGLLVAVGVLMRGTRLRRSVETRAWQQGADGEAATEAALAPLERDG